MSVFIVDNISRSIFPCDPSFKGLRVSWNNTRWWHRSCDRRIKLCGLDVKVRCGAMLRSKRPSTSNTLRTALYHNIVPRDSHGLGMVYLVGVLAALWGRGDCHCFWSVRRTYHCQGRSRKWNPKCLAKGLVLGSAKSTVAGSQCSWNKNSMVDIHKQCKGSQVHAPRGCSWTGDPPLIIITNKFRALHQCIAAGF